MANENIIINEIDALVRRVRRGETKIAADAGPDVVEVLIAGEIYPFLAPGKPLPMDLRSAAKSDTAAKEALEIASRTAHVVLREHQKALRKSA